MLAYASSMCKHCSNLTHAFSFRRPQQIFALGCWAPACLAFCFMFMVVDVCLGQPRNNMHKELLSFANRKVLLPQPYVCRLTFKQPYNQQIQMMLLPHELFSALFHSYKDAWSSMIVPNESRIKEFWDLQVLHPAYANHPILTSNEKFRSKLIPLSLHGDGTPVIGIGKIWSRQLTTWSWNSLLGKGRTKSMQLQIWSMFDQTSSAQTLKEYWAILAWSFKVLQQGVWPSEDHKGCKFASSSAAGKKAGTWLAEGYAGILWTLVGDLEYLTQYLKLPHYGSKTSPCALCQCKGDYSDTSWRDCRPNATWVGMQWTPEAWQAWEHRSSCDLFRLLPGLTACATAYDFMHSKYLGTDMVFLAGCLWLLCYRILEGSPLDNLQLCWQKLLEVYKKKKILDRYRGMSKLSIFERKKGGPKMKGRAAQIAALAEPMLELWQTFMDTTDPGHRQIKTWLKMNVLTEQILKDNAENLAISPADYPNFKTWSFAMAQLHRTLAQHYADETVTLFSEIPKLHSWLHTVLNSNFCNPRLTWCFRQEDYMAVQRTLAKSSCKGLKGPQVTAKICSKVRVGMHLQFMNL